MPDIAMCAHTDWPDGHALPPQPRQRHGAEQMADMDRVPRAEAERLRQLLSEGG